MHFLKTKIMVEVDELDERSSCGKRNLILNIHMNCFDFGDVEGF